MDSSKLRMYISLLNRYTKTGTISNRNIHLLEEIINEVRDYLPIPSMPFRPAQLVRVTLNRNISKVGNRMITEIKYLKYPPPESITKFGRCNLIGQSMLYGSFNMVTASKEMRPEIGDLVTISTWKLKQGMDILTCPIFYITSLDGMVHNELSLKCKIAHDNYFRNHFSNEYRNEVDNLMEFFAKAFAKEVAVGNWNDYFLSAYLTNIIFNRIGPKIEMLIYPSVQESLESSNMAIRPEVFDEKFELYEVSHGVCITNQYPGFFYEGKGMTRTFDLEYGLIRW